MGSGSAGFMVGKEMGSAEREVKRGVKGEAEGWRGEARGGRGEGELGLERRGKLGGLGGTDWRSLVR